MEPEEQEAAPDFVAQEAVLPPRSPLQLQFQGPEEPTAVISEAVPAEQRSADGAAVKLRPLT